MAKLGELVEAVIKKYCIQEVADEYAMAKETHRTEYERGFGLTMLALFMRFGTGQMDQLSATRAASYLKDQARISTAQEKDPLVLLVVKMQGHKERPRTYFFKKIYESMVDWLREKKWGQQLPSYLVTMAHDRDRQQALEVMKQLSMNQLNGVPESQTISTVRTNSPY